MGEGRAQGGDDLDIHHHFVPDVYKAVLRDMGCDEYQGFIDGGPGLPPSENLFVPFFTTKRGGSGIGLVLARQIVEAHGGALTLENRDDARGCVARLRLPAAAGALTRPRWGMR